MVAVLGITTAVVGLSIAIGQYVLSGRKAAQVVANETNARLLNELVVTRVGQAIASTAILCSEVTRTCYWNKLTTMKASDFRFSSVSETSTANDPMTFSVEVCIPTFSATGVDLVNCSDKVANAEIRFIDLKTLQDTQQISGANKLAQSDTDHFGVAVTVASTYINMSQAKQALVSTSVVRRPRPYLRIDTGESYCSPTCQVSVLSDGPDGANDRHVLDKSQDFCLGLAKIVNNSSAANTGNALALFDSTKATIKYKVYNDGPGYVYRYSIDRTFTPGANFVANGMPTSSQNEPVFPKPNTKDDELLEIEAGGSRELSDSGMKCYDQQKTITNQVTIDNITTLMKENTTREVVNTTMNDVDLLGKTLRDMNQEGTLAENAHHWDDPGAVWETTDTTTLASTTTSTALTSSSSVTTVDSIIASPSNPTPAGVANYNFKTVEPSNALSLIGGDGNVTSTLTTTNQTQTTTNNYLQTITNEYVNTINQVILVNTGMN